MIADDALALSAAFLCLAGLLLFARGVLLLSRDWRATDTRPRIQWVCAVQEPLATLADRERYGEQV